MARLWRSALALTVLLVGVVLCLVVASPAQTYVVGVPALAGRVLDQQGRAVRGAEILFYLNEGSEPHSRAESDPEGFFVLDLPDEPIIAARLVIAHPHFESAVWRAGEADLMLLNQGAAIRVPSFELERRLTAGFWVAVLVFGSMLVLIVTERLHRTTAALLGAAVVLGISLVGGAVGEQLFIIGFERAVEYVDFNVVFLVLGMMIVIGTIERTGIFQWLAYQAYLLSRGRVWMLVIILMIITSVGSALLDNVTTMLLMTPITLQIALALGIDPLSLLLPEVLVSNVGGVSTLIGTPTNILIGSYAGITFNDFLANLTPGVLMAQAALTGFVLLVYREEYGKVSGEFSPSLLERLKENARITQPVKLRRAGAIFAGMLVLFVVGERIRLVPAVTAMLGGVIMLIVVGEDVEEILQLVDWKTLLFFILYDPLCRSRRFGDHLDVRIWGRGAVGGKAHSI